MASIQFQKEGRYHEAVKGGGRREVVIPVGTVQRNLTDAQAHRWERRGVAVRIPDDLQPAIPPAPPAPAPAPVEPDTTVETLTTAPAPVEPPAPPAPPAPAPTQRTARATRIAAPVPPAGEGNGST
jgi:hypothetical protein